MPGRRYSEGLHQALEAKEDVQVQPENVTLASITFQNYFRLYKKLAGMTGTASTEADEFAEIYKLDVVEIPTNMPVIAYRLRRRGLSLRRRKAAAPSSREIESRQRQAAADAGRHHLDREIRTACRFSEGQGLQDDRLRRARRAGQTLRGRPLGQAVEEFRRAQRPVSRTGSLYRRRSRRAGRDHHRHQHGRPRHRYSARRQSRHARAPGMRGAGRRSAKARRKQAIRAEIANFKAKGAGGRRPLHHRHRAAREPPHRQPVARPRRPPGRSRQARNSSCRCRTI